MWWGRFKLKGGGNFDLKETGANHPLSFFHRHAKRTQRKDQRSILFSEAAAELISHYYVDILLANIKSNFHAGGVKSDRIHPVDLELGASQTKGFRPLLVVFFPSI